MSDNILKTLTNKTLTVAIEDLSENAIQDALGCVHNAMMDCEFCCLDNKEDKERFLKTCEKWFREAFGV